MRDYDDREFHPWTGATIGVLALLFCIIWPPTPEKAQPNAYIGHFNGAPCRDTLPADGGPLECRWVFPNGEWVYTRSY